jgi:hypothetical protein
MSFLNSPQTHYHTANYSQRHLEFYTELPTNPLEPRVFVPPPAFQPQNDTQPSKIHSFIPQLFINSINLQFAKIFNFHSLPSPPLSPPPLPSSNLIPSRLPNSRINKIFSSNSTSFKILKNMSFFPYPIPEPESNDQQKYQINKKLLIIYVSKLNLFTFYVYFVEENVSAFLFPGEAKEKKREGSESP